MYAIGLMSGTSLDGVDACLVEITKGKKPTFKNVGFVYLPYQKAFKMRLLNLSLNKPTTIQEVCSINVELGKLYLDACLKLIKKYHLKASDIAYVGMHGQTVWHNPIKGGGFVSSTLQLGDPSTIANGLNVMVVSNFRAADVALGGSGAPLVPFVNYILYSNKSTNIALQNIGGIANLTYLKAGGEVSDIIAFDTGPGNMLIDLAAKRLFNVDYDDKGRLAAKGRVIEEILSDLLKDPYLDAPYPKSTGREKYNDAYLSEIVFKAHALGFNDYDILRTLVEYTAETICYAYQKFIPKVDKVLLSGGGASNDFLVERLSYKLSAKIEILDDKDSIEAMSFAILGYYTLNHLPSNVPQVTGASHHCVLGEVTNPIIGGKSWL